MPRTRLPLDGERLFVAHCSDERTFASHPAPPTAEDLMAAIAVPAPRSRSSRSPRPVAPTALRLLPPRLPARRPPSATVRRRRAVALWALAALGALLGAGSLAGAGQAAGAAAAPGDPAAAVRVAASTHVVQPGDTLWSLARRIQPEGDVRPLVARLRAEHGGGPLMPGQRLRLAV